MTYINTEVVGDVPVGKKQFSGYSQLIYKEFSIIPHLIYRTTTGNAGKYHYKAFFNGLDPMVDSCNNALVLGYFYINRKRNPKWMPPKEGWVDNIWRDPNDSFYKLNPYVKEENYE